MSKSTTWSTILSEVQAKSKALNPTSLLKRNFVNLKGKQNGSISQSSDEQLKQEDVSKDIIRVMQWNLLAQGLCQTSDGFVLCPHEALDWNFRQHRLLEELLTYQPTVFCLQEVDQYSHILSGLSPLGFDGVFFPKPDSPCLYQANNCGPDGCAMLWDTSRLELVEKSTLVLCKDCGKETNQVAIVCRFKCKGGETSKQGSEFVVATTHLKAKSHHAELRGHQGRNLEQKLRNIVGDLPLIVSGDFNADPDEKAVEVIKSSKMNLQSAYTLLSPTLSEPAFTTWKIRGVKSGDKQQSQEVAHTIDYLFFSKDKFECLRLLEMPDEESLKPNFLPSFGYPSDHLSLVADFKIV